MAVTHIVLFKFNEGVGADAIKDEKKICDRMLALRILCVNPMTQQPYIKSLTGGIDHSPEGLQHGYTHAFVVEFASVGDRDYYVRTDPAHQNFKGRAASVVKEAQVLDYTANAF